MAKQIQALRRQTAALASMASALQTKIASLEGERPAAAPAFERAGGDLTGLYPNPQIRTGTIVGDDIADGTIVGDDIMPATITGANVIDGTIGSAEILNGSITEPDLAPLSVGAPQLTETFVVESGFNLVGNHASGSNEITCPPGSRLLSGGVEWDINAGGLLVVRSAPSASAPDSEWKVLGLNNSGEAHKIRAKAVCLAAHP
jgi:hypothetical protein